LQLILMADILNLIFISKNSEIHSLVIARSKARVAYNIIPDARQFPTRSLGVDKLLHIQTW
jgi:hypothetical protein